MRHRRGRLTARLTALVAALVLSVGLGGCQVGRLGMPGAAELYADARTKALGATSGAFRGTTNERGVRRQVDWSGSRDGSNSRLLLTDPDGAISVIRAGGRSYLKAPRSYYLADPTRAKTPPLAYNNWVRLTSVDQAPQLSIRSVVMSTLAHERLSRLESLSAEVSKVTVADRDGYRVTLGDNEFFEVDAKTHLLLRIRGGDPNAHDGQTYDLTFSSWGAAPRVEAPRIVNP